MSGTGHGRTGYPGDLLNRTSTGALEIPTVIDRTWETGRSTAFKIKQTKEVLEICHVIKQSISPRQRTASIRNANFRPGEFAEDGAASC
jgi:hypothetical protein